MKTAAKRLLGRKLKRDFLEKLTEYAIAETEPVVSLDRAQPIATKGTSWDDIILRGREDLWTRTLKALPSPDILMLEFGVWRGESMAYLLQANTSEKSRFFGFDSFEGLPEDWRGMAAERFDRDGELPDIDDDRLRFVKGWFRDTLPGMLDELEALAVGRSLIVHFDADLYSSSLYLLFILGTRFKSYHFIFDEFSGHETRALFNFAQATGAKADFLYRLDWEGFAQVVSGELHLPS